MAQGSRQRINESFDHKALLWAGGLFVGEGSVQLIEQAAKAREGLYRYSRLSLKMLDGRSVARFGQTFGLRIRDYPHNSDRRVYQVRVAGEGAVRILRALYPYLATTTKGEQVNRVLARAGLAPVGADDGLSLFPGTELQLGREPSQQSERRPRAWLLDTSKFENQRVIWASGLFAAEGYAFALERRSRGRVFRYPAMSLTMHDSGAVRNFASTFFLRAHSYERPEQSATCHRVQASGSSAEAALRAMYRHIRETDKGDQIKSVFRALQLELNDDGSGATWKRENGLRGRSLTLQHRAHISQGQQRRWERERRGF